jgi:hypothetical protein
MGLTKFAGISVSIIFICCFSIGIFQYLGLPPLIPKIISESLAFILFMMAVLSCLNKGDCSFKTFGLLPVGGVIAAGLISGWINDASWLQLLIFTREIVKFYLLFLALINLQTPVRMVSRLLLLIVILFLIQIPVSWLKFIVIGIDESWIGTVQMNAGELSLLLPMFASSFLFASFLYKRKMSYLILVSFFFMFSIIGEKEAAPFVFHPLLIFLLWYYYLIESAHKRLGFLYSLKKLLSLNNMAIILSSWVFVIFLSTQLLSSLNPEEKKMGTFNLMYVVRYALSYNLRELRDPQWNNPDAENDLSVQMGRFQIISESFRQVAKGDIFSFLFGYGGGSTSTSAWAGQGKDIMYKRFGIRGATPAMVKILLECGVVGLAFMLYLFFQFYRAIHISLRKPGNSTNKGIILGILGMHIVFLFDFLLYSSASLFYGILTPIYFFLLALLIKDQLIPLPCYHLSFKSECLPSD